MRIKTSTEKKLKNHLRWHIFKILYQVEFEGAFSNHLINQFYSSGKFSQKDQRLLVHIVYGTLQRRLTIDYHLEPLIKEKRLDDWVISLLRMSVYQLLFMDKVPAHAILNESVMIAKWYGHQGIGNLVNAILRKLQKVGVRPLPDKNQNFDEYLSIASSTPLWILNTFKEQLAGDEERLEALLFSLLKAPTLSLRIVREAEMRPSILQQLEGEGIVTEWSELSPYGLRLVDGNLFSSSPFNEGKVTVQDESSMLVAPLGVSVKTTTVLDACTAPGGKVTHMAQILKEGHIDALDVSQEKLQVVSDHLVRMNLQDKVTLYLADARHFIPPQGRLYDTIFIDAPCSGLGLLRRKPEIKYEKSLSDIKTLSQIQADILDHLQAFLVPGGQIIYSTCTLTLSENEEQIQNFLENHPDFEHKAITESDQIDRASISNQGHVKIWPDTFNTDGFFITRLIKKRLISEVIE